MSANYVPPHLVPRGTWQAGTYHKNDLVQYNGSSYFCHVTVTTGTPGVSSDWSVFATAGTWHKYIQSSPSSSWSISHVLGREPLVQIFLANNESVIADVVASDSSISVAFATPTTGYALYI